MSTVVLHIELLRCRLFITLVRLSFFIHIAAVNTLLSVSIIISGSSSHRNIVFLYHPPFDHDFICKAIISSWLIVFVEEGTAMRDECKVGYGRRRGFRW